jgi:hypothetical protein
MARGAKVVSSPKPPCVLDDDVEECYLVTKLHKSMCSLCCSPRAHFEYLMDITASCNEPSMN